MEVNELRDVESIFAEAGRPPNGANQAPSIAGHHHSGDLWSDLRSGRMGRNRSIREGERSLVYRIARSAQWDPLPRHGCRESLRALIPSSSKPVLCNGCRGLARPFKEWWPSMARRLSRSHNRSAGKKALHLVSAWAVENRLVLAQLATEEKSNEITAIPLLLQQLALAGCIVTIDAMGTQTKIAEQIIEQEAESALARKRHPRKSVRRGPGDVCGYAEKEAFANGQAESERCVEKGHGRLERRRVLDD